VSVICPSGHRVQEMRLALFTITVIARLDRAT
jgi:hypothetical protein